MEILGITEVVLGHVFEVQGGTMIPFYAPKPVPMVLDAAFHSFPYR